MQDLYARDVIVALYTKAGLRLFGLQRQPPDALVAADIGRFNSLIEVGGLDLNSVPLGTDLVGSLAAAEQSTVTCVFSNIDLWWSKLVMLEPVMGAMGGIFLYFSSGKLPLIYRGRVSRIRLRKVTATIELSEP